MKILIIDIETTGFLNQGGKISEIGIVELNLKNGNKKILFDKVINPNLDGEHLAKTWIVTNGYMTVDEIQKGVEFKEVKAKIQGLINQYPDGATAFNRKFDFDFLESYGIRFVKKLPCPMERCINIVKLPPTERMKMYRPDIQYKTPNCEEAYNFFHKGADFTEKHRGADDAWHEADIVYELYKIKKSKNNGTKS